MCSSTSLADGTDAKLLATEGPDTEACQICHACQDREPHYSLASDCKVAALALYFICVETLYGILYYKGKHINSLDLILYSKYEIQCLNLKVLRFLY